MNCGQHSAIDCSKCPFDVDTWVSEGWCNGDCHWVDQECLPITTRTDVKDDIIYETTSPTTSPTTTAITTTVPSSFDRFESSLKSEETTTSEQAKMINSSNFLLQHHDNDFQVG